MDKKHSSCINMHCRRNVKLLIEKFECMSERRAQLAAKKRQDLNMQSISGRVAATVAKFEHSCFLSHRFMEAHLKHSCGDQPTDHWLIELKHRINQITHSSQAKLIADDNSKELEHASEPEQADVQQEELLEEASVVTLVPPVPPVPDALRASISKHLLSRQGSDTSVFAISMDLPTIPSFNGFDFCDEDEVLFIRASHSCTW